MSTATQPIYATSARGPNILLGLGSAIIFAVSVTNAIVYAQGTTSSNGTSSGTTSGGGEIGVNSNCAMIMLIINIIIAIISFIAMIYFFYKAIYSSQTRAKYESQAYNAYYAGSGVQYVPTAQTGAVTNVPVTYTTYTAG
jgi:hypothetical protein